jgi:Protein of unknown function, DUF481
MRKIMILLLLTALPLYSQVVNIESKRMRSDSLGWLGSAEGNFQLAKQVETIFDLGCKLHFQYKHKNYLWLFLNEYRLIKGGDDKFVNSAFAHVRYNHKVTKELLRWEAFTQVQYNGVLDIGLRWLAGTGPRFKIYDSDLFRFYVAALYMYEYEENTQKTIFLHKHRMSSYATLTLDFGNVELINTTYYQPNLKDFDDDFRVVSQTDLLIGITENLKFKTGYLYRYDSMPFPNIPKVTYGLTNGLVFEF